MQVSDLANSFSRSQLIYAAALPPAMVHFFRPLKLNSLCKFDFLIRSARRLRCISIAPLLITASEKYRTRNEDQMQC